MTLRPWSHKHKRDELDSTEALAAFLAHEGADLTRCVVQGVDLREVSLVGVGVLDTIFLGCTFSAPEQSLDLVQRGAAIFPLLSGLPYDPYRSTLYSVDELLAGYEGGGYVGTADFRTYAHFDRERRHPAGVSLRENLAQRLHDHAIDDALYEALESHAGAGVVAIMGGHGTPRSDPAYRQVVEAAFELTQRGYFVASGGGPGIMEASNLGAWLSGHGDPAVIDRALDLLVVADTFDGGEPEGTPQYLAAIEAFFAAGEAVRRDLAPERPGASLAIPTWFYGHEPTNLFASHVAKYFSNGLREDGLLAIATGGVVYAPGSAGTLQEVFMDLAQNHYATFEFRSPMVFLGRERWRTTVGLIEEFVAASGAQEVYGDLITLCDDPSEAVAFIAAHPPRAKASKTPLYELT